MHIVNYLVFIDIRCYYSQIKDCITAICNTVQKVVYYCCLVSGNVGMNGSAFLLYVYPNSYLKVGLK